MKIKYYVEFVLLLVTLLWGATFTIVKESLNDSSPLLFISVRFSIAALILLPFVFKNLQEFNFNSVRAGLVLGVLLFFPFATQTIGLKYTTATKSGFLTGSLVVMIPIFQLLIEKRKPTKGAMIGVLFVFIGIMFLSSGGNSLLSFLNDIGKNFNIGDAFTLTCAVLFAIHVVYLDIYSRNENIFVLFSVQIIVTAVLASLFTFISAGLNYEQVKFHLSNKLIFGFLYTAIFATLITTAIQTKYQKAVSPTKAGLIYSFEPIFAAVTAFFVLNEKITNFGLVGCLLIFLGLVSSEIFENIFNDTDK